MAEDKDMFTDSSSDDTYALTRPRKRRRTRKKVQPVPEDAGISLVPLLRSIDDTTEDADDFYPYDDFADQYQYDYLHARNRVLHDAVELDEQGHALRPLTRYERATFAASSGGVAPVPPIRSLIVRKLRSEQQRRRHEIPAKPKLVAPFTISPLPPPVSAPVVNPEILNALNGVRTTPFRSSFLSRLHGVQADPCSAQSQVVAIDWNASSPWMELMDDVREHYKLAHPQREHIYEAIAPIHYVTLQASHLPQIHDILRRTFWVGIDVSDSLTYVPERSTIVAAYKSLVVGVALLSSPVETYITYLAVRAGWENARIATNMLYHLASLVPGRDITLHVSASNSAMLLYNRFGFKAEEFVAGFYEDYLDPHSRASKNAIRLRLRR